MQRGQQAQPALAKQHPPAGGNGGGSAGGAGSIHTPIPEGSDPALAALLTSLDLGRFLPQFAKVSGLSLCTSAHEKCCFTVLHLRFFRGGSEIPCFAYAVLDVPQEEMDMEAFGMLDDEDLQEMGIAKGPRLKLLQAISQVASSSKA